MVVYGDPEYGRSLGDLIDEFSMHCQSVHGPSLDESRRLLIQAGQIEQGLMDLWESQRHGNTEGVARIQEMTDLAAQIWREQFISAPPSKIRAAHQDLVEMARAWSEAPHLPRDTLLRIKIPEGFAFYGLFPEQYLLSAMDWGSSHPEMGQDILVIGLRSIGSTLSAAVLVSLRAMQRTACRMTVRPRGHPYRRQIRIAPELVRHRTALLIVDEGPGASGSSMASVAHGAVQAGMALERIYFFPGHAQPPGSAALPEVLHWWNQVAKVVTPLEKVRWEGRPLEALLLERANEYASAIRPFSSIADVSAGLWRRFAFKNEAEWPAACVRFERHKYLCQSASGNGIVWKFTGLHAPGPESDLPPEGVQHPKRLGHFYGYTAFEWVPGRRLVKESQSDHHLLQQCAHYLVDHPGAELSPEEANESRQRLGEMLYWNVQESLGRIQAEKACSILPEDEPILTSYSDGRMAPYEWVITPRGRLYKIHDWGRDRDHTMVGRQSIIWDVAGFIVEWELEKVNRQFFVEALKNRGLKISPEALHFYQAAYAAFRLGQTSLSASMEEGNAAEKSRLHCAARNYQRQVAELVPA